jgi:acetyl esterase/lipase
MTTQLSMASRLMHVILRLTGLKRMFINETRIHAHIELARLRQMRPYQLPKMLWRCGVHEAHIAGMQVIILNPWHDTPSQTVVYVHGGAYVFEPSRGHWQMLAALVHQSGVRVVVPIYPRLPKCTVDDALPLLMEMLRHIQGQYGTMILAGDSAGGGLALALAIEMRTQQMTPAQAIVLLSPWLDVTMKNPEIPNYEEGDLVISAPGLRTLGQMWAGSRDVHHPWVSPLYADLNGLPPITIIAGGIELFMPDVRLFKAKVIAAGVLHEYHEFAGCMHAFMLLPTPEGRAARKIMIDLLKSDKEQ